MPERNDLWKRIAVFSFDEGGEDLSFAERVVEEYRRLMYLAVVCDRPVCGGGGCGAGGCGGGN